MLAHLAVLFFLIPPFFPQNKVATPVTSAQVVAEVQKFYKNTKQLSAKFRQVTKQKVIGRSEESNGRMYIQKPGMMRWDYSEANKKSKKTVVTKSFISDGKVLWAVFMKDKQYYKKDIKKDLLPVAVTFLYGQGDLSSDFSSALDTSSKYGAKGDLVLKMTPNKPSAQYKTLWLVVDPSNYRVKQSIVENSAGDTNHFSFFEPDTKTALNAKKLFTFDEKAARAKGFRLASPPDERDESGGAE